ncbi:hypothetical protein BKA80DRAFT_39551 [Phyllosticta citrichinensis]
MWRWNPYPRKSQTGEAFAQRRQGDGEGGAGQQPASKSLLYHASERHKARKNRVGSDDRPPSSLPLNHNGFAGKNTSTWAQTRSERPQHQEAAAGRRSSTERSPPGRFVFCNLLPLNHQPRRLKREDWPRLPSGCEWRSPPMRLKAHQPYRQTQPPHPNFLRAHLRCVRLAPILVIWVAWLMVPVTQ